ncbi:MAG: hypothetical protein PVF05_12435 [Gemmatimonadales bacterium]|jgi:uncharacterized membrane protein
MPIRCRHTPRVPLFVLVAACLLEACRPGPASDPGTASAGGPDVAAEPPAEAATPARPPEEESPTTSEEAVGPDLLGFHYRALGTEPFWGIEVTADSLVYTTPESDPLRFRVTKVRRWAGNDVVSGEADGRAIEVTITRGACSDGMSDRRYEFTSRVLLEDRELTGCAFELGAGPSRPAATNPVEAAGLRTAVEGAREIRARESWFERYVGSLDTSDGTTAMFAAHFEGDDVRMIEFRISRGDEVLRETTYYFAGRGGPEPAPSLVDGEMRARAGDSTTWFLLGYDASGAPSGQVVQVDGHPVGPPNGLVGEELQRSRRLVAAARRARR